MKTLHLIDLVRNAEGRLVLTAQGQLSRDRRVGPQRPARYGALSQKSGQAGQEQAESEGYDGSEDIFHFVLEPNDTCHALSPWAEALLRGAQQRESDLRESGGTYSTEEVSEILGAISRQAVWNRVRRGHLLAVKQGRNYRYPACQFTADGSVLEGLRQTFEALGVTCSWFRLHWLLHDRSLFKEPPLVLLERGEVAKAVATAESYGEQATV